MYFCSSRTVKTRIFTHTLLHFKPLGCIRKNTSDFLIRTLIDIKISTFNLQNPCHLTRYSKHAHLQHAHEFLCSLHSRPFVQIPARAITKQLRRYLTYRVTPVAFKVGAHEPLLRSFLLKKMQSISAKSEQIYKQNKNKPNILHNYAKKLLT